MEYQVGNYVQVRDPENTHSTYEGWAIDHIQKPYRWRRGMKPIEGGVYQITAIGEADRDSGFSRLYALSDVEKNTYIMNRGGFVRFEFRTILEEMDAFFDFGRPLEEGEKITIDRDPERVNTTFKMIKKLIQKEATFLAIKEEFKPWRSLIEKLDMYFDFSEPLVKGEVIPIRDVKKVNDLFAKLSEVIIKE